MSKYLKLFIFNAVFFSFSALFVSAQNSETVNSEEEEEEKDEEEEAIKTLTTPSLVPTAELSGIESNDIIENLRNPISSSLSFAEQSKLLTNINNPLTSKLNFNQQVQLIGYQNDSTLSNLSLSGLVVLAQGELVASQVSAIGSSGVDSAEIIALGTANIVSLASKLSGTATEQATQFKTLVNVVDAYSNVEADASKVGRRAIATGADITTIVGSTVNTVTTDHLETLSKLDTSHMKTFAGDGISNIDNFATRVDVTSAMVGDSLGTISNTNLGALVENLHSSLDGDSLTALKSLEKSHMTTLVGSGDKKIDLTSSFDATIIKSSVKKFATKAEVTVEFAKAAAPTSAGGVVDLSKIDIGAIATNIHANLDDDHLTALQQLSPTHMATMATGVDLTAAEINVGNTLSHFATKAEVVVEFAKVAAPADAGGKFDFTTIKMDDFVSNIHTNLDEDHTKALAKLDPSHMATMATGTDLSSASLDSTAIAGKLSHFATKGELASGFIGDGGANVDIDSIITNVHETITVEHTTSLATFSPSEMLLLIGNTPITQIADAGTKAKTAHHFINNGADSLNDIMNNVAGMSVDQLNSFADLSLTDIGKLAGDGGIDSFDDVAAKAAGVASGHHTVDSASDLTGAELDHLKNTSLDNLIKAKNEGKTPHDAANENTVNSLNVDIDTAAKAVKTDAKGKNNTYTNTAATATNGFPKALESAVKIAELILTDKVINNDNDLADDLNVGILSGNGYNTELIRILAKYGALGSKGGALADAVLGSDFTAFNKSINLSAKVQPGVSYYQQFLSTLGARAMGPDKTSNHVHINTTMVSTSNIKLSPGANVTFNASAEIDASDVLPKGDRRIAIIGAAKDMTIKGNLNIKNSNTEENGVMVLGAADDFYLRSEYGSIDADYNDPALVSITNEGANLAIGSEDTMRLVNVSISTGGNLAIGTLNELHIGLSDGHKSYLSVGNGGQNSDPDNIYLYANELIQINGMEITGRVDDVYMEAVTINLRNVTFPHTSEVTLRSRNGTIGFSNTPTPTAGSVNMYNVKHGSDLLSGSSFNGVPGKYATNKVLPNGTPAVQVKKF
jgi:hypothetical protein